MRKYILGLAACGLVACGCAKEPSKAKVEVGNGVEINAPGVKIKAGEGGTEVQAPGVEIKTKKDKK